ncbi:MAG TPA: hypothetical protein VM165_21240, partial [Planctomycetaceae bacterium]|nr:hypothetical protein [Planctomycetaceae bacterium]
GICVALFGKTWIDASIVPFAQLGCGLFGSAFLMLAMWVHGWHVAYVTPDPPASTPFRLPSFKLSSLSWLIGLLFGVFKRKPAEEEPAPKRRKKSDETGTTKRKRKTKRTATRRSRPKVAEEEEAEDEEAAEQEDDERYEEEGDSAESDAAEEQYDEDELEEATRPSRDAAREPVKSSVPAPHQRQNYQNQAPSAAKPISNAESAASKQNDEEDDGEEGDTNWRVDGPSQEQLKGLSKKQRRALIKQHRDQQRSQR